MDVGGPLQCKGQFVAHTEVKVQSFHFRTVVVVARFNNLLCRSGASRMGLILKVNEFKGVFSDIGCLKTEPVKIALRGGAEPYALRVAEGGTKSSLSSSLNLL